MAIQILPEQGIGEKLGTALGGGVQQALSLLVQNKLKGLLGEQQFKQKQQLQREKGRMSLAEKMMPQLEGYTPEDVMSLFGLGGVTQQGAPQQQAAQLLAGAMPQEQQQMPDGGMQQGLGEQPLSSQAQQGAQQEKPGLVLGAIPQERMHREKMLQREQLAGQKIGEQRELAYKKDIQDALKTRAKLENQGRSLENLKKYSSSGKLTGPMMTKGLKAVGMDWMLSPESQAFESEVKSFYDSFREMFGARPIGLEFEAFKGMLPSLMQSKAGRELIFDNLDAYLQAKRARSDAVVDAFKGNKNLSPIDMALKIEDLSQKKINSLKKKELSIINDGQQEFDKAISPEEEITEQQQPQQPLEKEGATLGQKAQGLFGTALTAPLKLAELPLHGMEYLASKGIIPKPTDPENLYNAEKIKEAIGGAKPENVFEKTLDYTAGNWPMLFLGGGTLPMKLSADVAGSFGLAAAEKMTDNPWLQVGASVLGSAGFGKIASLMKKAPTKLGSYINKLYDSEKKLGAKIKVNTEPIKQSIENLYEDVEKKFTSPKFSPAAKQRTLENIKVADQLVTKPTLTASDLFDVKKNLNQLWAPGKSIESQFNKRLQKTFFNKLENVGKSNKVWGDTWKHADNLYKIQNWQTGLTRWMNSNKGVLGKIASNPVAQGAVAILGGLIPRTRAGALAAGGVYAGAKGAEALTKSFKFLNELGKTNEGRKILWELTAASAKNTGQKIASAINKINKKAKEFNTQ